MAISNIKAYSHLTDEDIEEIGRRLDAIQKEVEDSLGDNDVAYIKGLIRFHRPQRHPRPMGLDERPRDPLHHLGMGHDLPLIAVDALPQLRPPQIHQHLGHGQ